VFVVEGPSLVAQAAAAGWEVEAQFVAHGAPAVTGIGGAVHELGPNVIERVASTDAPQAVLAVVRQRTTAMPSAPDFVVVLHGLADPGNAGTIIRSAEAAGAHAVVFTAGSVDAYNPKVVRASAGSLFRVPLVACELEEVRSAGLRLWATSSHHGVEYTAADLLAPVAIVIGNEAHGLPDDSPVDDWVTIPHAGPAESLNAAMAATVLLFEVARQRRQR